MSENQLVNINEFLTFQLVPSNRLGICKAVREYIPISHFKDGFNEIAKIAIDQDIRAILFDKSNLTVFHQPSMEWYYTEWKKKLVDEGINTHFKILPELPWFHKSVEAGKSEIKRNNPDFNFDSFSVTYVSKTEEAIAAMQVNH